jgi:hypothetical protein
LGGNGGFVFPHVFQTKRNGDVKFPNEPWLAIRPRQRLNTNEQAVKLKKMKVGQLKDYIQDKTGQDAPKLKKPELLLEALKYAPDVLADQGANIAPFFGREDDFLGP